MPLFSKGKPHKPFVQEISMKQKLCRRKLLFYVYVQTVWFFCWFNCQREMSNTQLFIYKTICCYKTDKFVSNLYVYSCLKLCKHLNFLLNIIGLTGVRLPGSQGKHFSFEIKSLNNALKQIKMIFLTKSQNVCFDADCWQHFSSKQACSNCRLLLYF